MNAAFWAQLDARIACAQSDPAAVISDRLGTAGAPKPAALPAAPAASSCESPSRPVADWTKVPDTLSAASVAAQEQDQRMRQQSTTCEAVAGDLEAARQEIQSLRALLQEAQAQAAVQVRAIETRAGARVREAEARAEAANLRAESAEDWLKRIEQASRDLLPNDRRAAA